MSINNLTYEELKEIKEGLNNIKASRIMAILKYENIPKEIINKETDLEKRIREYNIKENKKYMDMDDKLIIVIDKEMRKLKKI